MNNKYSISAWFRGIKGQLLFAAIIPIIGFVLFFSIALSGIKNLNSIVDTAHETLIPNFDALGTLRSNRLSFTLNMRDALDFSDSREKYISNAEEALKLYKEAYKNYTENPFIEGEAEIHDKAKPDILNAIALMEKSLDLIKSKDPEKIKEVEVIIKRTMPELGRKIVAEFTTKVDDLYTKKSENEKILAKETEKSVTNKLYLTLVAVGLLVFGILLRIASKVSNSILNISNRLSESSTQVASAVNQLNAAGTSLSTSSTEAAASLEETVASLEEMTSMVSMGADNAKQAAALAVSSRESAETGAKEIQNLIASMNEISTSSKKIEEIISVIDDIAFQTNLLALNAAVEAARAGEQGKGFAVVAEAVRALAQRSATSAKDIATLIKESVQQIENGTVTADKSGALLSSIVTSIKKVSDLNNEIATASQEQATGIEQINQAMSQLDQAGQANAAAAEQIAASATEINELANVNQQTTDELISIVVGVKPNK